MKGDDFDASTRRCVAGELGSHVGDQRRSPASVGGDASGAYARDELVEHAGGDAWRDGRGEIHIFVGFVTAARCFAAIPPTQDACQSWAWFKSGNSLGILSGKGWWGINGLSWLTNVRSVRIRNIVILRHVTVRLAESGTEPPGRAWGELGRILMGDSIACCLASILVSSGFPIPSGVTILRSWPASSVNGIPSPTATARLPGFAELRKGRSSGFRVSSAVTLRVKTLRVTAGLLPENIPVAKRGGIGQRRGSSHGKS